MITSRTSRHRSRRVARRCRPNAGDASLPRVAVWLDAAVDGGVALTIFVAPFFLGGRAGIGRLLYVTLAMVTLACWLLRSSFGSGTRYRWTGLEWCLAAAALLVIFQAIPLPPHALQVLAPRQAEVLPYFSPHATSEPVLGSWNRLSLYPRATLQGLGVLLSHGALFIVLIHRLRSRADAERLLQWTAAATVLMAAVGLLQYFSGTDKFMWIFAHPSRAASHAASGPFSNSNHFAHFLAVGLGPLIWCLEKTLQPVDSGPTGNTFRSRERRDWEQMGMVVVCTALGVVALAGLLASSRGGILMLALAVVISVTGYVLLRRLPWSALLALGGVAIVVALVLKFHGADHLQREMETLTAGSVDQWDHAQARRKVWSANLRVAGMFPWLGTGVGTHAEAYLLAYKSPSQVEYTHAESGYLQILTECGWCGIALLASTVLVIARWCWRSVFRGRSVELRSMAIVTVAGLVVSAVHSVFDFPWFLTACMSLTVILSAVVWFLAASADDEKEPWSFAVSPNAWLLGTVGGVVVGVAAIATQVGPALAESHWNQYLRISLNDDVALLPSVANTANATRSQPQQMYSRLRRMARHLQQVIRFDPGNARAHLRLSTVLLKSFELLQQRSENSMGLVQIRDAAVASQFTTVAALHEWLHVALGDNHHLLTAALRHVRCSLAALSAARSRVSCTGRNWRFWRIPDTRPLTQLLDQAAKVRPYDAAILFAQGKELALQGDTEGALEFWKRSFHQSAEYRDAIIQVLSRRDDGRRVREVL